MHFGFSLLYQLKIFNFTPRKLNLHNSSSDKVGRLAVPSASKLSTATLALNSPQMSSLPASGFAKYLLPIWSHIYYMYTYVYIFYFFHTSVCWYCWCISLAHNFWGMLHVTKWLSGTAGGPVGYFWSSLNASLCSWQNVRIPSNSWGSSVDLSENRLPLLSPMD